MRCEAIEDELKALLDDEQSGVMRWRISRHIDHCPNCRAEWDDMRRLNEMLGAADFVAAQQNAGAVSGIRRNPRAFARLSIGAVAAALLIGALLFMPGLLRHRASGPGSVYAALSKVNTWTLSGWKQIGGKHVPWVIWGRRSPFLFYERVGDNVTVDDGTRKLRIYPADPSLNRPNGLVVITADDKNPKDIDWAAMIEPSVETMIDGWNWSRGGGMFAQKPFYQSTTEEKYRRQWFQGLAGVNTNLIFTIDRFTMLPARYQLHYQTPSAEWDTEYLTAAYGLPVPDGIVRPTVSSFCKTVDLTQPGNASLDIEAKPVAIDTAGDILVRYRARLAGNVLSPSSSLSTSISTHSELGDLYGFSRGRTLIYLDSTAFSIGANAAGYVYGIYCPLAAAANPSDIPRSLHVTLDLSPTVTVRGTDIQLPPGSAQVFSPSSASDVLFQRTISRTIILPGKPNVTRVDTALPAELSWVFRRDPLAVQADQARVNYYRMSSAYVYKLFEKLAPDVIKEGTLKSTGFVDLTHPGGIKRLLAVQKAHTKEFEEAKLEQEKEAIPWQERVIEIARRGHSDPSEAPREMLTLAAYYGEVKDNAGMLKTLHELLATCETLPERGGLLRRQAEYALKTRSFPSDAEYKGPS